MCKICYRLDDKVARLERRAKAFVERVNYVCWSVRDRNNTRWRRFAWWCTCPLIGKIIQAIWVAPPGLEMEPRYENEDWFLYEMDKIVSIATRIEEDKKRHMDATGHFGDEPVIVRTDHEGYERIEEYKRIDCYQKEYTPSVPIRFDFRCEEGRALFLRGALVMSAVTREIVPVVLCERVHGKKKPVYFKKSRVLEEDEITAGML